MNADFSITRRKKFSAFSAFISVQKGKCQVVRDFLSMVSVISMAREFLHAGFATPYLPLQQAR